MKNLPLLVLLAASLAANAWFAFARSATGAPENSAAAAKVSAAVTKKSASGTDAETAKAEATASPAPFVWKTAGASETELRALAAGLRAAGFPPNVIVRFVGEMLRERTFAEVAKLPFWQLLSPGRETRKLQTAAGRELLRLQEEILGPAGAPVATLDPLQRRLEYGSLSDDRVAAILRIERDYEDLRADVFGSGGTITREESDARRKAYEDLEKERLADVAAALSPGDFAEYERHKSPPAERIGWALRELTVTEEQYVALLEIEKARNPYERSAFGSFAPATADVFAYMDKVRAALGDDGANAYLKSGNFAYGMVARAVEKIPGMTAAKTYELYKLQNQAQAAMMSDPSGAPRDPEKLQATMTDLNAQLDTLLGAEAAAAYRAQGNGGVFNSFRSRPTTNAAPPKG